MFERTVLASWTAAAAAAIVADAIVAADAAMAQPCGGAARASGVVRTVADARTLVLEDGRQLLLEGIEVPRGAAAAGADAPAARAVAALKAKLVGRAVTWSGNPASPDRHGRLPAFVFADGLGLEGSVQHDMVSRGLARVAVRGAGRACAAELLARERWARAAKRGLWADPDYAVRRADDPASILALRGRMALVEGRVLSVRESGGTIYVNFGRRWSQDFTATIAKRNEELFAAGGLAPKRMERRWVRVRGWVEERGGPWIEVTSPEQIELLGPE